MELKAPPCGKSLILLLEPEQATSRKSNTITLRPSIFHFSTTPADNFD